MPKFSEQLRIQTQEAELHRLCRVTSLQRRGHPVRIYEVRDPSPENLAKVSDLVRRLPRHREPPRGRVSAAQA